MFPKIRATLKTANGTHEIEMPLKQNDFDLALNAAHIFIGAKDEYKIESVTSNILELNESLPTAKDIEEINYLAQRLDSFDKKEIEIFGAIVKAKDISLSMQELINLTYNIWEYNIELGIHDIGELGQRYVESEAPDLPEFISENIDYEAVGMDVHIDNRGEFTDVGYISNFNQAFEKLYNGKFFPDYDYEGGYTLKMELKGVTPFAMLEGTQQSVFILLPASENIINRALHRLGVESIADCYIAIYDSTKFDGMDQLLGEYEDLNDLNVLAKQLDAIPENKIDAFNTALPHQINISDVQDLIRFAQHYAVIQPQKEQRQKQKPDCPLIGADGNIFNLMGIASKTLKRAGMPDEAKEMCDKIKQSGSYYEALNIIGDYVNITDSEQSHDMEQGMDGPQMNM